MTDEQKAKDAWLYRARDADKEAAALEAKAARDMSIAQRLTRLGGGGGSGSGNSTQDAILRYSDTRDEAASAVRTLQTIRAQVEAAIDAAGLDRLSHAIMVRKYLDYESMEQIAESVGKSRRQVCRIKNESLDKIKIF